MRPFVYGVVIVGLAFAVVLGIARGFDATAVLLLAAIAGLGSLAIAIARRFASRRELFMNSRK